MAGAAAIAAAPYLGIDPDGTARARVRAVLRRDADGHFKFLLREDEHGLYLAAIYPSDAQDDRTKLQPGDRLKSIDGAHVRADFAPAANTSEDADAVHAAQSDGVAPAAVAAPAAAASSASDEPPAAPAVEEAGLTAQAVEEGALATWPSGLTLDEAKRLVRASGQSVVLEVYREEVRPAVERLGETKAELDDELAKALDLASPRLSEKLSRVKEDLVEKVHGAVAGAAAAAQPHVARLTDAQQVAAPPHRAERAPAPEPLISLE